MVLADIAGPKGPSRLAAAEAAALGERLFVDAVDRRPVRLNLDAADLSFFLCPTGAAPPEPPSVRVGFTRRQLIVVRPGGAPLWCVVDPLRWAAAGADGETAMLSITSCETAANSKVFFFSLSGRAVTVALYHESFKDASRPGLLRFDRQTSFSVQCRGLAGSPRRRLVQERPELRLRVFREYGTNYATSITAKALTRWKTIVKSRYPSVLVPEFPAVEGEGVVLVEPVLTSCDSAALGEPDRSCPTPGIG